MIVVFCYDDAPALAQLPLQLRFDARRSSSLPNDVAIRLMKLAGSRLTQDGVIVIVAQAQRSQKRNREEALARLIVLIREATHKPVPRVKTKVSRAAKRRRVNRKIGPTQTILDWTRYSVTAMAMKLHGFSRIHCLGVKTSRAFTDKL